MHKNVKANPKTLAKVIKPFQDDLAIAVECILFAWYWIAGFCEDNNVPFVLGHVLYVKAIHEGKAKNDKLVFRAYFNLLILIISYLTLEASVKGIKHWINVNETESYLR